MSKRVKGSDLSPEVQASVLGRFIHRITGDHRPVYAHGTPLHFASDAEWLENTYFQVRNDGTLDRRTKHCESYPTWPTIDPLVVAIRKVRR